MLGNTRTPKHTRDARLDRQETDMRSPTELDAPAETALYMKKCELVNQQLDAFGMGKYQWYIFGLCGLGYLLDLLWAQAFNLVLSPLQQELGFGNNQTGNISVAFSSGLTAGAFVWGALVDVIGRRWAFNLTVFIAGTFGIALGALNSYPSFLVLTAFVGFGVGGNIPIDTTITLEFLPRNRRSLLALLSIFQPLGQVLGALLAYAFIPNYSCSPNFSEPNKLPSCRNVESGTPCCSKESNMGWRYLLYTIGAVSLTVFGIRFLVFNFQESPAYLIYRGHDEKAVKVLEHIAKFNKTTSSVSLADFDELTHLYDLSSSSETSSISSTSVRPLVLGSGAQQSNAPWSQRLRLEVSRYKLFFATWTMVWLTALVWLTYAMDYWAFTIAGAYLPRILALKNADLNLSLRYTYRSYIYIYLPGTVGVAIGALMYNVPAVGRKWTMVVSSGLTGVSIFCFSAVNSAASNIGLNAMKYFFQAMFNAVLYGWTPEAYPAPIRGTASGVASFWGRLSGIVGPLVAQTLYARSTSDNGDINAVLYLAGGVICGCVITTALLPSSTLSGR